MAGAHHDDAGSTAFDSFRERHDGDDPVRWYTDLGMSVNVGPAAAERFAWPNAMPGAAVAGLADELAQEALGAVLLGG